MYSNWYGGYMDNFVRIYNDVMTNEKCQYFVDKFEAHSEMQEIQNNSQGKTLTMMDLERIWIFLVICLWKMLRSIKKIAV